MGERGAKFGAGVGEGNCCIANHLTLHLFLQGCGGKFADGFWKVYGFEIIMKEFIMPVKSRKAKYFMLSKYVEASLQKAEYQKDENNAVIAKVPGASGFFAQGNTFEEARANLQDVIEGNVMLALQLGLEIPRIEGVEIKEIDYA